MLVSYTHIGSAVFSSQHLIASAIISVFKCDKYGVLMQFFELYRLDGLGQPEEIIAAVLATASDSLMISLCHRRHRLSMDRCATFK